MNLRNSDDYAKRVLVVNHVSDIIPQLPLVITEATGSGSGRSVAYAPMSQSANNTIELYESPVLSRESYSNSMRKIHSLQFYSKSMQGPYRLTGCPISNVTSKCGPAYNKSTKSIHSFLFRSASVTKLKSD